MSDPLDKRYLAYSILEFLDREFKNENTTADSKESLEVAMQCLETAFNINLRDEEYRSSQPLHHIFRDFLHKEGQRGAGAAGMGGAGAAGLGPKPSSGLSDDAIMQQIIDIDKGELYVPPPDTSPDSKNEAETHKNIGNEEMKGGKYEEAMENYTQAINLDGRNAVYFCNRAAAHLKLNNLDKALRDCQIAIQLNRTYARAYGRMGVTYSTMNDHLRAYACYRKALELEPDNESYMNNLGVAQERLQNQIGEAGAAAQAAGGGVGGDGVVPNIQTIFNNPSLINMATQMLQDPNMQNMMRSIITGFNTGGNDTQSVDSLLQMGQAIANQIRQSNPNLAEEIGSRFNNQQEPRSSPQGDSYDL